MNTLICVCNHVFDEWLSDILFGCVEILKTTRVTEMLKNEMWHSECWGGDTLYLPYKQIDKFLFSILKSTRMGMEIQKIPRGHAKCDNGTETNPKRIEFTISYVSGSSDQVQLWMLLMVCLLVCSFITIRFKAHTVSCI